MPVGRAPGNVYPAPLDVVLSDTDVVQPDLLFLAGDRLNTPLLPGLSVSLDEIFR